MGLAGHGVQDDFLGIGGKQRVQFARGDGIADEPRIHDDEGVLAFERRSATEHFIQDRAYAIDIGARVATLALDLFGRHVIGRAHRGREPGEREAPALDGFRDAEIHDAQRAIVTQHDIGRLEVAMDDVVFVHVIERVAHAAANFQRVRFRHWPHGRHEMRECVPLQVFGDNVRTALVFDRDEPQQERMIQDAADFLLTLKPPEKSRVALVLHMRDFDGDLLAALAIGGAIDHGHAAAADDLRDLETVIHDLARVKLAGSHRLRLLVINGRAAIIAGRLDAVDADHLHGDVVLRAALFRERDQLPRGLLRREAADQVADLRIADARVQPVAAQHDAIALRDRGGIAIDADHRLLADAARENRTLFARQRLAFADQTEFPLHADIAVVRRKLPDQSLLNQVHARIADVADRDLVVP